MSKVSLEQKDKTNPISLPQGWVFTQIQKVCETKSGGTPSRKKPEFYNGNIPWVKSGELNDSLILSSEETITELGLQNSSATIFPKGIILMAMYGATIGKLGILNLDASTNQAICAFFNDQRIITSKFLFYFLKYRRDNFIKSGFGGAQNNISQEIIREIKIPIAPLNEQKRIVSKIEELFSEIDFQFQTTKQTKNLLKLNIKSLLKNAFNGNLTKTWRATRSPKKPKELLNEIEKERENNNLEKFDKNISGSYDFDNDWEVTSLGFITENHDGKRIPVSRVKRKEMTGNYPYYGASGIIDYVNKPLFKGRHLLIGEDGANLLARSTPIAFIADGEFWVNNHAHVLTTLGEIPLEFVSHFINSIDLSEWVTGTAQPKLNQRNMNKIPIPIPSIEEQIEIVKIIEQDLSLIDKQFELLKIWSISLSKLRIAILKQAFEGKLAPQDPNDEPVEILLQKIKQEKELEQKQKIIKAKVPKRRRKNVK